MSEKKGSAKPEIDLEFVETQLLVDELMRRSVAIVIAYRPIVGTQTPVFMFNGNKFECFGLAETMKNILGFQMAGGLRMFGQDDAERMRDGK